MTDVVRELQALADLAARHGAEELVLASRRMHSLLERLRNQFVVDVVGETPPVSTPIRLDRYRPTPVVSEGTRDGSVAAASTAP